MLSPANNRFPPFASRRGFTLVELLLTLAVIATVAAVAVVPLAKWQKSMPIDQSVATLQQELAKTRLMAIDEAAFYTVTCEPNSNTFTRTCTSNRQQLDEEFQLADGITFAATEIQPAPQLMFQSDGTVSDSLVMLQDSAGMLAAVKMERLTGMVRLIDAYAVREGATE